MYQLNICSSLGFKTNSFLFTLRRHTILLVLLFFCSLIYAQDPTSRLFEIASISEQQLTAIQLAEVETLRDNPSVSAVTFVTYNNIFEVERDGKLLLQLPDNPPFVVEPRMVTTDENEGYLYNGTIDKGRKGYVSLLKKGKNYFGQINYRGKSYRIETIGETLFVLLTQNLNNGSQECTNTRSKEEPTANVYVPDAILSREKSTSTSVVDILVTYSNAANSAVSDVEAEANLLVDQLNTITQNSGIPQSQVSFNLIDVINANFDETGYTTTDMESALTFYTFSDFNQQRANTYGADIVVMLTDHFTSYGWAFPDKTGDKFFCFAIAEINSPAQRYSFAHEVAHVFGCRHDNDNSFGMNNTNISSYANGYIFSQGGQTRRTLLSTADATDARIMHLSNPAVNFNGVPTGIVNDRNNARQMTDMACVVADYRDLPPDPTIDDVIISGYDAVAAGDTETWCAQVFGCTGSSGFQWEYSTSGPFNGWITSTTGNCASFTMPLNSDLWLRVTATCDFGSSADSDRDVHYVRRKTAGTPPDPEQLDAPPEVANTNKALVENIDVVIFPNPTERFIKITVPVTEIKSKIQYVSILGLNGDLIARQAFSGESTTLDLSQVENGVYLLRYFVDDDTITRKIVVHK